MGGGGRGVFRNFVQGGLNFFPGWAQHPLEPENLLKPVNFTGPGEAQSPNSPPNTPLHEGGGVKGKEEE